MKIKKGYVPLLIALILSACIPTSNNPIYTDPFYDEGEVLHNRQCAQIFSFNIFHNNRIRDLGVSMAEMSRTASILSSNRNHNRETEFRLVYNFEMAKNTDFEKIVPAWATIYTDRIIFSLNHFIIDEDVNLENFGLSYPITRNTIIDDCENVYFLYRSFNPEVQNEIMLLTFYIQYLFMDIEPLLHEKINFAEFWLFESLNDSTELDHRSPIAKETAHILREYAWHIEMFGAANAEIILVGTEEEAESMQRETNSFIIYLNNQRSEDLIQNLNTRILSENIDLSEFSLTYPITEINLINDWEKINALMNAIDHRHRIRL